MTEGQVLEFHGVTKRFGAVSAVTDFSARIEPGLVTGFLGPNGAGKTTSLRMLLGLIRPTSGRASIGGKRYTQLKHPMRTVGAALEASSFHPGRSGANHLKVYAQAAGIPRRRVDEVLGIVGLADAAGRKVGGYSMGMRQRLALATALLGDPGVVVLDEPTNGLDPEGIRWMRSFLRHLAGEGRTVLMSSHLLSEVQQTVDSLVIIAQGRRVFQGDLDELASGEDNAVVVDAPDRKALGEALREGGFAFETLRAGLTIRGGDPVAVGATAAGAGVALSMLHRRGPALEEVFLELAGGLRMHPSAQGYMPPPTGEPLTELAPPAEPAPAPAEAPGAEHADAAEPAAEASGSAAPATEDAAAETTATERESEGEAAALVALATASLPTVDAEITGEPTSVTVLGPLAEPLPDAPTKAPVPAPADGAGDETETDSEADGEADAAKAVEFDEEPPASGSEGAEASTDDAETENIDELAEAENARADEDADTGEGADDKADADEEGGAR